MKINKKYLHYNNSLFSISYFQRVFSINLTLLYHLMFSNLLATFTGLFGANLNSAELTLLCSVPMFHQSFLFLRSLVLLHRNNATIFVHNQIHTCQPSTGLIRSLMLYLSARTDKSREYATVH